MSELPRDVEAEEARQARADIAGQYAAAVSRLDAVVTDGGSYTAVQTRDAVVDLARILRRTLRLLKAESGA